jgi:hypothetical protein
MADSDNDDLSTLDANASAGSPFPLSRRSSARGTRDALVPGNADRALFRVRSIGGKLTNP